MKICHFDFSYPLEFYKNSAVLVCESPRKFLQYCNDFIAQQNGHDGEFIIQDEQSTLSFKKHGRVLSDCLNLSLFDKKIVSGLYEQLAAIKENEMQGKYVDLVARIISFVDELAIESPMAIDYNADFDIVDLFKVLKVCPNEENTSFVGNLIDYLDAAAGFLSIKLFVIVNVRTFLTDNDFANVLSHISYASYSVLFLERTQFARVQDENIVVIDEDLCEIVVQNKKLC